MGDWGDTFAGWGQAARDLMSGGTTVPSALARPGLDERLLSEQARSVLERIAAGDGNDVDLSSLDVGTANPEDLVALLQAVTQDREVDVNERELVAQLYGLLQDRALLGDSERYQAYDFDQGQVTFDHEVPPAFAPLDEEAVAVQRSLIGGAVNESRSNAMTHRIDPDFIANPERQGQAREAQQRLRDDFAFGMDMDPTEWYSRDRLAEVRPAITGDNLADFMQHYLTGLYEHAGTGTAFTVADGSGADRLFFGRTGHMSQTADGRRITDCQGFTYLGQALFNELCPPALRSASFYLPIEFQGTYADGREMAHEMGLMVVGDRAFMVNNTKVEPIPVDDEYLQQLRDLYQTTGGQLDNQTVPEAIGALAGGPIYAYALDSMGISSVSGMQFDSGHVLKDG